MSAPKNRFLRYLVSLGAGSMLISIIFHVIIALGATYYVVTSIQTQRKAQFKGGDNGGGSTVQHSVKMSNTQPKLDTLTQRLSVDSPNAAVALPDLPSLSSGGSGSALVPSGAGVGAPPGAAGYSGALKGPIMPLFGFKEAQAAGTLVGRLYDLKQFRDGKANPDVLKLKPGNLAAAEVTDFVKGGWNPSSLAKFFQAPTVLYATQIFVPNMNADAAPKAYGVEKQVEPKAWIAHYRGKVSPPTSGAYRFVGAGDDHLAVRLDGRLVLDGSGRKISEWKSDRPKTPSYDYDFERNSFLLSARKGFTVGNRMELRAGQFYDIDIVFSEGPGGLFCAMLLFEQEGVTYAKDAKGNPILPIFRVSGAPVSPTPGAPVVMPDGPIWKSAPVK
jgi:PA14 domain